MYRRQHTFTHPLHSEHRHSTVLAAFRSCSGSWFSEGLCWHCAGCLDALNYSKQSPFLAILDLGRAGGLPITDTGENTPRRFHKPASPLDGAGQQHSCVFTAPCKDAQEREPAARLQEVESQMG